MNDKRRISCGFFLQVAVLLLLAGFVWTPYEPVAQAFLADRLALPSLRHPMGIDGLGRDVLSRVWRGGSHTLLMGAGAMAGAAVSAALLLVVERTAPRFVGRAVQQAVGVWIAIPVIFVGLLLLVFLNPSPGTLVFAAAVGLVPLAFRQLRVFWMEQIRAEYVRASVILGADYKRLFFRTLWPNLKADVAVLLKLLFALAVLELSGLAFLGLIGDPDFPELGALLRENQRYLFQRPMLVFWPGLVLTGLLVSVQLSGTKRK